MTTPANFRTIRGAVLASTLAVAASGAIASMAAPAFAGEIEQQPDCTAFEPDNFVYDHEINGHDVTVLLAYEDDWNTCDVTVTVNTWTLPFKHALEWEPGAAVFATDHVSLNDVEAATKQGAPLGVTLPTPECHTQTEVIIGTTDMGGYKWSYDCEDAPDDKLGPQGGDPDPDPDPDEPDPDEPGDDPQEGSLPETGATTGIFVALGSAFAGLGLAAVLFARRRPASVR